MLVRAAVERAAAMGARTVDLTSRPSRADANRLYVNLGFEPRETNVYRFNTTLIRLMGAAPLSTVARFATGAASERSDVHVPDPLWLRCRDQRKEVVQLNKRFGTLEVAGR